MLASSQHKSPSSLSPLSSRFAAHAEREDIRRLKQECRGLSAALKLLKKGSKESMMIKSKLDVASEELTCVLEDRLFRSFTTGADATSLSVDDCLSLIPTPPLASAGNKANNGSVGQPAQVNVDDCLSSIPTPPLTSARKAVDQNRNGPAVNGPKSTRRPFPEPPLAKGRIESSSTRCEQQTEKNSYNHNTAQNRMDGFENTVQKYSLEWFQSRVETTSYSRHDKVGAGVDVTKSVPRALDAPRSPAVQAFKGPANLQRPSPPAGSKPKIDLERRRDNGHRGKMTNLSAKLEMVPKFSIEWFTIKKAMKSNNEEVLCNGDDPNCEKSGGDVLGLNSRRATGNGNENFPKADIKKASLENHRRQLGQQQQIFRIRRKNDIAESNGNLSIRRETSYPKVGTK